MDFSPGDVVLVAFPFADQNARKKRPAVVVSPGLYPRLSNDIVLLALTSQRQDEAFRIRNWRDSGLLKETWCKPVVATVSSHYLMRRMGTILGDDIKTIRHAISKLIHYKFRID